MDGRRRGFTVARAPVAHHVPRERLRLPLRRRVRVRHDITEVVARVRHALRACGAVPAGDEGSEGDEGVEGDEGDEGETKEMRETGETKETLILTAPEYIF